MRLLPPQGAQSGHINMLKRSRGCQSAVARWGPAARVLFLATARQRHLLQVHRGAEPPALVSNAPNPFLAPAGHLQPPGQRAWSCPGKELKCFVAIETFRWADLPLSQTDVGRRETHNCRGLLCSLPAHPGSSVSLSHPVTTAGALQTAYITKKRIKQAHTTLFLTLGFLDLMTHQGNSILIDSSLKI